MAWLTRNRDRYGDVVPLSPRAVTVHNPEFAHEVLAATNSRFTVDNELRARRRQRREHDAHVVQWMTVRHDVWHTVSERIKAQHITRFTTWYVAELDALAGHEFDLVDRIRYGSMSDDRWQLQLEDSPPRSPTVRSRRPALRSAGDHRTVMA